MGDLFKELGRRNVFRVAAVYAVVGWLAAQIAALAASSFGAPGWVMQMIIVILLIGFPVALVLAWAFEMTPEGMKLTAAVPEDQSIAAKTGRKLDYAILGGLALVGVMIVADRMLPEKAVAVASGGANIGGEIAAASIAVLPFADLSPDGDQEYFTDGVSEEILNVLAKASGLRVASRTSAFAYEGSPLRLPEIAKELKVRHILEGSVRRAGETIRVTAQLIDAETDEHLWSDTFDRRLTTKNVFAIQEETAKSILAALEGRIEGVKFTDAVQVTVDTGDLATLDLYYEANALFIARGKENLQRALTLFEDITARDPQFARGWAGLATVATVAAAWGLTGSDFDALAREAATRAIALDPNLSSPYATLAHMERRQEVPDWKAALDNFEIAERNNPNDPNIYNWRSIIWAATGFINRSIEDYNRCLEIDPSYVNCGTNKHTMYVSQGRLDEAADLAHDLLLLGSTAHQTRAVQLRKLADSGQENELLQTLAMLVQENSPGQRWIVQSLYQAYTEDNIDYAEAYRQFNERLKARSVRISAQHFHQIIKTAFRQYETLAGDRVGMNWFSSFPDMTERQKRQLIEEAGVPSFWREYEFPPNCRPVGTDDYKCEW